LNVFAPVGFLMPVEKSPPGFRHSSNVFHPSEIPICSPICGCGLPWLVGERSPSFLPISLISRCPALRQPAASIGQPWRQVQSYGGKAMAGEARRIAANIAKPPELLHDTFGLVDNLRACWLKVGAGDLWIDVFRQLSR
jgi:hypothetical protein